ncbi:hypothetical protein ACVWWO_003632 [Bradyrhizobium sp. F1.13.1]
MRISIGVPERLEDLEWALRQLADALEIGHAADMSII